MDDKQTRLSGATDQTTDQAPSGVGVNPFSSGFVISGDLARTQLYVNLPSPYRRHCAGCTAIPAVLDDLPRSQHSPALGARQNYFQAVQKMLERNPDADALMVVQDDAWWPPHLPVRQYLEQCLWPGPVPGLVSAWCSSDDTQESVGWYATQRPWRFGAVAFIFPRECAERFIHDPVIRKACAVSPGNPSGGLSMLIGDWAARLQIPISFPTPSLVQHLGDVSTIYEMSRAVGVRHASRFLGNEMAANIDPISERSTQNVFSKGRARLPPSRERFNTLGQTAAQRELRPPETSATEI